MATVTNVLSTSVTTNSTQYTSASFSPNTSELLLVFAVGGATNVTPVCSDNKSGTYTLVTSAVYNTSADRIACFVGDQLVTTSSMTITIGYTGDAADGCIRAVYTVASTQRTGAAAIKQSAVASNQVASTPTLTLSANASSSQALLAFIANLTNPATLTPPTGWTEGTDTGYATPTHGAESVFTPSSFNGTTLTWGSTSASAWGGILIEIDESTTPGSGGSVAGNVRNRYFWGFETSFTALTTTAGAVSLSSSDPAEADFAAKLTSNATRQQLYFTASSGIPQSGVLTWREKFHVTTTPTSNGFVFNMGVSSTSVGGNGAAIRANQSSSGTIYLQLFDNQAGVNLGSSVLINDDQWYQIALMITPSTAATGQLAWWLDGVRQHYSSAIQTMSTANPSLQTVIAEASLVTLSQSVDQYYDAVNWVSYPSASGVPETGIGI